MSHLTDDSSEQQLDIKYFYDLVHHIQTEPPAGVDKEAARLTRLVVQVEQSASITKASACSTCSQEVRQSRKQGSVRRRKCMVCPYQDYDERTAG